MMTYSSLLLIAFFCSVTMATAGLTSPAHLAQDVDPSDPEVQACASFALDSFNFFSKDPCLYTITKFYSVKRADIGGGQYDMDVEVRKTQSTEEQMGSDITPEHEVLRCHFVILSAQWKKQRVLLHSSCSPVVSDGANTQPS